MAKTKKAAERPLTRTEQAIRDREQRTREQRAGKAPGSEKAEE